jgi:hypothetical protein
VETTAEPSTRLSLGDTGADEPSGSEDPTIDVVIVTRVSMLAGSVDSASGDDGEVISSSGGIPTTAEGVAGASGSSGDGVMELSPGSIGAVTLSVATLVSVTKGAGLVVVIVSPGVVASGGIIGAVTGSMATPVSVSKGAALVISGDSE